MASPTNSMTDMEKGGLHQHELAPAPTGQVNNGVENDDDRVCQLPSGLIG